MQNIKVVIGANFGDEGKGKVTDFFCKNASRSCINVLNNGGAQRGHTVYKNENEFHIFHHFGAGTFNNVPTYCSSAFILNPMTYKTEYDKLTIHPDFFYHCGCRWSTPFDMMVNQIVEEARDGKKHGSCGMGIWETVDRYRQGYSLPSIAFFATLPYERQYEDLVNIRDSYFINRLNSYNINEIPTDWKELFYSDTIIKHFIDDVKFFVQTAKPEYDTIINKYDTVVIENGQGLLLDQNNEFYGENYTTPSTTGSGNAFSLINAINPTADIELCYVTRSYMTRHGNGRFETEKYGKIFDKYETNATNEFQGNLRYGELIIPNLYTRIDNDAMRFAELPNTKTSIAVTHLDEKKIELDDSKYKIYKFDSAIH